MKFNKYCIGLLVCVVLLLPTESAILDEDTEVNILNAAIPNLAALSLLIPPPVGPIVAGSLGLLHVTCVILADVVADNNKGVSTALSQLDLLKSQQVIQDSIKNVDNHVMEASAKVIRELTNVIESHEFMENLRIQLEKLRKSYANNMKLILNSKTTGFHKNETLKVMLEYYSPYRENLRSFITTYIKPSTFSPTSGRVKLFFDFVLEKDHLLAMENDDCYTNSVESRVFTAYMYILKILTDNYVMVISAHVKQFQQEIQDGRLSDAESTKIISKQLIDEYKNDMKELFEKTKWALDNASRDIKNCGVFDKMEQGVDYERLSFAKIFPRPTYMGDGSCLEDKDAVDILNDYEVGNCDVYPVEAGSHLSIFYNPSRPDGPYQYMKVELPSRNGFEIFGNNDLPDVIQSKTDARCNTFFCNVFKKNGVGISTELVRAQTGNVITGMRFRVRKNVIYIDIQQGKYLDPISVDPKTVFWSETPESTHIAYFNSNLRKIELGDFELRDNNFLTTIQFRLTRDRGFEVIQAFIDGSTAPNWYTFGPYAASEKISQSNEVKIKEADDPEILGNTVKNFVSKAPVANQPHFITFQPSGFRKDFGRTTVPFIDTREVVSYPPAPLGGFGIYHQAGSGSGGFLSLKLLSPQLSNLVEYKQIEEFTKVLL